MKESRRGRGAHKESRFTRQVGELSTAELQALLDEARAGSTSAYDKLATYYRSKMVGYFAPRLSELLRAKIGAEDLAQTACLLAWRAFDRFRGEITEYGRWLRKICYNVLRAVLRRFRPGCEQDLSREEVLDEAEAAARSFHRRRQAPDDVAARQEATAALHAGLEQLPPDECKIVDWHVFDRLTFVEIGARLVPLQICPDRFLGLV